MNACHVRSGALRHVIAASVVALASFAAGAPSQFVSADSTTIDFEGFTVGTVNAQGGWSSTGAAGAGCATYDHLVANNTFGYASFGSKSLRISNAVASGCFSDQTFSKSLVDEAGESSATNDGQSGGTRQPYFEAQWDFASTVPGSEQPGLAVVASPDRGDGARMSWVQMRDEPGGLAIGFYDYITGTDFVSATVATGLNRATPHTIKVSMQFIDGPSNDVVKVYVDGVLAHTGTSWEDYFREVEGNPTRTVDSVLFRTSVAAPATAGNGFLIDNMRLLSGAVPVPPCTTTCYVDAINGNDSNSGVSIATAFKTIQKGLTTVQSTGTVVVAAGTYTETLIVNKPLTLKGAQSGVLAKGRAGAESVIRNSAGTVVPLEVQADNVTVDGFTFDSAGLTAVPWTLTAINEPANGRFASLRVINNTFVGNPDLTGNGTYPGGMYVWNADDALIEGNYFNALGQHAVFMGNTSTNTVYRNNDSFANYNSNFSAHTGPHTGVLIDNNRMVEDSAVLFKIDGLTARNNVLTSSATTSARFYIGGGSNNILVEQNTWNSTRSAPVVILDAGFGYGANSNATVQDNVLNARPDYVDQTAGATLIDLRDVAGTSVIARNLITYTGSYTGAVHGIGVRGNMGSVTIRENEVNGSNADTNAGTSSAGIILRSTLTSTAVITVLNNKASGFVNGVEVQQLAAGVTAKINLNSITGNSINGLLNGTTLVDGEKNWWGNANGPTNAGNPSGTGAVVAGNVDFDPWLCDGTDTAPSIGFQPNATVICGGNPPDTFITGTPLTLTNAITASFIFTGSDDTTPVGSLSFECKLDAGSFATCVSPRLFSSLSNGLHTFTVRAKDPAGMVDPSPVTFTWTVDATPPTTTLLSAPMTTTTSLTATFTFTGSDNLTAPQALVFECSLDGGAWLVCNSPHIVSGLSVGTHQLRVRSRDEAGNVESTPVVHSWTVVLPEGAKRYYYLPLISK